MPEGDTIFRAAQTLQRALAGKRVERFESMFPQLSRVDYDEPLKGRTIESVSAVGKHLLITFSGGLTLRTHMRMNGSWHIYRRGEKWRFSRHSMRIVIETADFEAIGFRIPEAEFVKSGAGASGPRELGGSASASATPASAALALLGPDLLGLEFDLEEAVRRMKQHADAEIADVLLNQTVASGIGNVFKSEVLFTCRKSPFTPAGELTDDELRQLMIVARKQLQQNVLETPEVKMRRTTERLNPGERLWVYGRGGKPCRVCATPINRKLQGKHSRPTYWCPSCQPHPANPNSSTS